MLADGMDVTTMIAAADEDTSGTAVVAQHSGRLAGSGTLGALVEAVYASTGIASEVM